MVLRTILFWPFHRSADWADDNPVSALGLLVAIGALTVLFSSVALETGVQSGLLALDAGTATFLVEAALERPAYPVVAGIGILLVLFYNG